MLRSVLMLVSIVAMSTGVAGASTDSSFDFVSEAGAQPIGERTGHFTDVKAWDFDGDLILDSRGTGSPIRVLVHDAGGLPAGSHIVAATVIYEGIGCVDQQAAVEVKTISRTAAGRITAFDGSVAHHCYRTPDRAFSAEVRYVLGES